MNTRKNGLCWSYRGTCIKENKLFRSDWPHVTFNGQESKCMATSSPTLIAWKICYSCKGNRTGKKLFYTKIRNSDIWVCCFPKNKCGLQCNTCIVFANLYMICLWFPVIGGKLLKTIFDLITRCTSIKFLYHLILILKLKNTKIIIYTNYKNTTIPQ